MLGGDKRISFIYRGKKKNRFSIKTVCSVCKKSIWSLKENNSKRRACSRKCQNILMSGKGNPNFKGRKFKDGKKEEGHVLVYAPKHPFNYKNSVPEHRLVVEKSIGRYLKKTEIVHHIDCVKHNNVLKNLFVCSSVSEHNKVHGSINKIIKPLLEKGFIKFNRKTASYEIK